MKKGVDYTGITVVFACHDGEGNYLMCKRSPECRDEQGTWDPGGGAVEFGDTLEETLCKEIQEEYCTDVIEYENLGFRDVHRINDGVKTHWVAFDYKVLVDRSKVKNGEPHKLEELGWFKLDVLPAPLHSQFPNFLNLYKGKL